MLQILVNHYNEDNEIIERFLKSLATQKDTQFEVIIASDGGKEKISQDLLAKFSFPITYFYLPHSGVCHTRNILLDKATSDYVMFCDIDDMFCHPKGLSFLNEAAEQTQADIIGSAYYEEIINEKEPKYMVLDHDTLRVHGKIFKREYLLQNNIRFPDELQSGGDMMFLWLAYGLTNKIIWIKNKFYIWKNNQESVTKKGLFPEMRTIGEAIQCYMLLAEDLKKRNKPDIYQHLLGVLFSMMYIRANSPYYIKTPQNIQDKINLIMDKCLSLYYDDYIKLDENYRKSRYNLMLNHICGDGAEDNFNQMMPWIQQRLDKQKNSVLIIGCGIVGTNLKNEFQALNPDVYDKYKNIDTRKKDKYAIAFVCVNTPKNEKSLCDITEVKNAIMENNADIFVLKSTILPGTVDKLCEETGKKVIFSPEYYGETQHCNNFTFDYTILGGDKMACRKVQQILQKVYDGRHIFRIVDAKTAELVKYMENSFLATKVSFCQQFFNLAEQIGVDYEELRELFILDPRVNPSHTFVYRDQPWWDSKCLNKDVPAIAESYNAPLLLDVIKFNENQKK